MQFWNDLGVSTERIQDVDRFSERLYTAPVGLKMENGYRVTDYSNIGKEPEGEIGLSAAKKLLGDQLGTEDEITVRLLDHQSWPEETYDASLEVVDESEVYEDLRPEYAGGAIMLDPEETPPNFEYGKEYDFIVFNGAGEVIVADQDYEFDLQNWR